MNKMRFAIIIPNLNGPVIDEVIAAVSGRIIIATLPLAPQRRHGGLYFQILEYNIHTEGIVAFLKQLHRRLQRNLLVVWNSVECASQYCPFVA